MQVHAAYQESFFRKFLFIALICFAYALWCLYDGLGAYPAKLERAQVYHGEMLEMAEGREAAWLERTQTEGWPIHIPDKPEKIESDITTQFVQIGIVLAIGIPMLLKYLLARGTYVAADDQAIRPSWRREAIPFAAITKIDKWFLVQIEDIVKTEEWLTTQQLDKLDADTLRGLKRKGFSDRRIGAKVGAGETAVREHRHTLGVRPVFKRVDTCAAEFATSTAYMYSTYEEECEAAPTERRKIMILGGGPNRIGQGIEFDYCCVHASLALREAGFETIMVNCKIGRAHV
jgi:hypothetical protein